MNEMQMLLEKVDGNVVKKVMGVVGEMTPEQKQKVLIFFHGVEFGNKLAAQQFSSEGRREQGGRSLENV